MLGKVICNHGDEVIDTHEYDHTIILIALIAQVMNSLYQVLERLFLIVVLGQQSDADVSTRLFSVG